MTPEVSVVMSIFNGAGSLAETMRSLCAQQGVAFEIIAVDDGSTDETPILLEEFAAKDWRIRVAHLRRVGLTRALIAGCAMARGEFIARQDCGDTSAPERLATQVHALRAAPQAPMSAVGARFVGPSGETLFEVSQSYEELNAGLSYARGAALRGPSHHGAVMFRKDAYIAVGGYREVFDVAQDLDLWVRLAETGRCLATPQIYYVASLAPGAISHQRRGRQLLAAKAIADCAALRQSGASDASALAAWREASQRSSPDQDDASFYYFVGATLRRRDPRRAAYYFRRALHANVWRPKAWIRLVQTLLLSCMGRRGNLLP